MATLICCLRCGSGQNSLRRVDTPVEGYVCDRCIKEMRSPVVKVGLGRNRRRMLVGPLADFLGKLPNAREATKKEDTDGND